MKNPIVLLTFLVVLSAPAVTAQTRPDAAQAASRNPHGAIAIPCDSCHTFTSWKPIRNLPDFDHSKTRFPLRGMHQGVRCTQCHVMMQFQNAGSRCADCHADLHRGQFGGRCEQCHSVKGWTPALKAIQEHQNRFPLVGAHATVDCETCHKNGASGQFTGLPTDCLACHTKEFQGVQEPNHQTLNFPAQCQDCHTVNSWFGAKFDHLRFAHYALTGAHAALPCSACHTGGQYKGTQANCSSCHQKDYDATADPNHAQAGFPLDCAMCHSTTTWTGVIFDHNQTAFPLTGAHTTVACSTCHASGVYKGLGTACVNCHLKNYTGTTNPNHAQSNIPQTCDICHNTIAWQPAVYDHNKTAFPLTGAHTTVACSNCHINGVYAGTPKDCYSCHKTKYDGTTNPNHAQAGFPTDCSLCHSTATWAGAVFDHNQTAFPLTGAHASAACSTCHSSGVYKGLSTACASCHLDKYNATTNPNHGQAGFPQTCEICHNTTAWTPSTFDHSKTAFPLTGAHTSVTCTNCHIAGVYAGTPKDCYSCHRGYYDGSNGIAKDMKITDPDHVAAGFSTACQTCHTTSTWAGATFNHTWFPIYSGKHSQSVWTNCSTCHTTPSNYVKFSCITACHTNKTDLAGKHSGVSGYSYTDTSCYGCHPLGVVGN